PARILARMEALHSQEPRFAEVARRVFEASAAGIAVAGFSPSTWAWWHPLTAMWPAQFVGEPGLGAGPAGRFAPSDELLDTALHEPELDDYLHALRISAGQVTLAGDTTPRPIREVYVDLEIQREEERRRDTSSRRRDDRSEEDRASIEALREEF